MWCCVASLKNDPPMLRSRSALQGKSWESTLLGTWGSTGLPGSGPKSEASVVQNVDMGAPGLDLDRACRGTCTAGALHRDAVVLYKYCAGTNLVLRVYKVGPPLGINSGSTGTILVMYWYCTGAATAAFDEALLGAFRFL